MIIENSLKYKEKNTIRMYTVNNFYILYNKQGDNGIKKFCHNNGNEALDPLYLQFEKLLKSYLKAVHILGRTFVQKYDVMHVFIFFLEYHIIYVSCFKRCFFSNRTGIENLLFIFRSSFQINLADIKLKEEIDRRNGAIFVTNNENKLKNYPYLLFVINIMKL